MGCLLDHRSDVLEMLMRLLGSAGLGLVWGWLIGRVSVGVGTFVRNALALSGATVILAIKVSLFADWRGMVMFLTAAGSACVLHVYWRRELRRRAGLAHNR